MHMTGPTLAEAWTMFALCAIAIGYAGFSLARHGDLIGRRMGWSGSWVGLVLLAIATSLPELVTGIAAVALAGMPDIAAGDALGSCVFNLLIFGLLRAACPRRLPLRSTVRSSLASGGVTAVLLAVIAVTVFMRWTAPLPGLPHMGWTSLFVLLVYGLVVRRLAGLAGLRDGETLMPTRDDEATLPQAMRRYAVAAAVIAVAGSVLPHAAGEVAAGMGWGTTFVGTLLVAATTSLPEVVVTFGAARMGALDMAIGNLFGSNLFNMAVLAVDDLFHRAGPLLGDVSARHAQTAAAALVMTGLALLPMMLRKPAPAPRAYLSGAILLVCYVINACFVY